MKGNKNIRGSTEWEKKFIDSFNRLCNRHHSWQVWQDFVNISACAIANAVDRRSDVWKLREDSYMATVKRYSKEELNLITELLCITTLALEENPAQDFLGKMYMQFNLENKWHGQFFTPWHIAEFMAKMLVGDETKEQIAEKEYISVDDPCCGAGCMLIAFANIELSYKRPEDIWYTPLYFTDIWTLRRIRSWNGNSQKEEEEPEPIQIPKVEESPRAAPVVHTTSQKPIVKKSTNKKKPFSWKEFFTVKGVRNESKTKLL